MKIELNQGHGAAVTPDTVQTAIVAPLSWRSRAAMPAAKHLTELANDFARSMARRWAAEGWRALSRLDHEEVECIYHAHFAIAFHRSWRAR